MTRFAICLAALLASPLAMGQPKGPPPQVTLRNFTNMPALVTLEHGPRSGPGVCVMPGTQRALDLDPRQPPPVLRVRAAPGNTCGARPVCEASIGLERGMDIVQFNRDGTGCSLTAANPKAGLKGSDPIGHRFVEIQNDNDLPLLVTFYNVFRTEPRYARVRDACVQPRMRLQLWLNSKTTQFSGKPIASASCEGPPRCESAPDIVPPYAAWGPGCAFRKVAGSDGRLPVQACPKGMAPPCLQ